jgi:hypothetical protein
MAVGHLHNLHKVRLGPSTPGQGVIFPRYAMKLIPRQLQFFLFIALTAINANAQSKESLEDAARDFAAYFAKSAPYVVRYEVGASTVSDNYPTTIQEGTVPKGTTLYPIRIHWYWANMSKNFLRSDFFLFQDAFGSWKSFYTHKAYRGNAVGPIWVMAAYEQESQDDACITDEQKSAFENWKQDQAEKEKQAANKGVDGGMYNRGPRHSDVPPDVKRTDGFQTAATNPTASPTPTGTPDTTPSIRSNEQATAAFNFLQDRLQKAHAKSVTYDSKIDSYTWIGPKYGQRMSMPRSQFEAEVWPDYSKTHPTETPESGSDPASLNSQIAAAEQDLELVYTRIRKRLNPVQREQLKQDEIRWITTKDSFPPERKLTAIRERTQTLRQRYGD